MKQIRNICSVLLLGISLMMVSVPSFSGDWQKGIDAYGRGDYQAALREWRPLAEQGYAIAQANLGLMYEDGLGVPQDDDTAVRWYTIAAEQGNADAQYNLGIMYNNGEGIPQDYKTPVKWYTRLPQPAIAYIGRCAVTLSSGSFYLVSAILASRSA